MGCIHGHLGLYRGCQSLQLVNEGWWLLSGNRSPGRTIDRESIRCWHLTNWLLFSNGSNPNRRVITSGRLIGSNCFPVPAFTIVSVIFSFLTILHCDCVWLQAHFHCYFFVLAVSRLVIYRWAVFLWWVRGFPTILTRWSWGHREVLLQYGCMGYIFCCYSLLLKYLINLSGTPFANWSETLPLHREWVAKSAGFNPITVHTVFNSLRNSFYIIFGISWSFPDPCKDLNIIGKFASLWSDCSQTFATMFLTRFWNNVHTDVSADPIYNYQFWCLPERHVQNRVWQ